MGVYPRINKLGPPGSIAAGRARHEWNTFQAKLLRACFKPKVTLVIATTAVRTGKTGVNAAFHREQAKLNHGVRSIWIVESYKWYNRIAKKVCEQLFGHEAVYHGTDHTWTWPAFRNAQLVICTYKDLQSMQGVTAGSGSMDESQNLGVDAHAELEQRISDKRAKHPCILITGLPEYACWPDLLGKSAGGISMKVYNPDTAVDDTCIVFEDIGSDVNTKNIHPLYLARLRKRLDPDEYERRVKGLKPMPSGRVFKHWIPLLYDPGVQGQGGNLIHWPWDPKLESWLTIDFGARRGACMYWQGSGDLDCMVSEDNMDDGDTEALCVLLRKTYVSRQHHTDTPERSKKPIDTIYCDPAGNNHSTAVNTDDIRVLRKHFPGVSIKYTYKKKLTHIPNGIRMVNARILNADGERRLLMDVGMWEKGLKDKRQGEGYTKKKRGRSAAWTIVRLKYPEDKAGQNISDHPVKCAVDSHNGDAIRYGIINRYGIPASGSIPYR